MYQAQIESRAIARFPRARWILSVEKFNRGQNHCVLHKKEYRDIEKINSAIQSQTGKYYFSVQKD